MKLIRSIAELKKGDTVIVKNCSAFMSLGLKNISGDIFNIERGSSKLTIKCKETKSFEIINLEDGIVFYVC